MGLQVLQESFDALTNDTRLTITSLVVQSDDPVQGRTRTQSGPLSPPDHCELLGLTAGDLVVLGLVSPV